MEEPTKSAMAFLWQGRLLLQSEVEDKNGIRYAGQALEEGAADVAPAVLGGLVRTILDKYGPQGELRPKNPLPALIGAKSTAKFNRQAAKCSISASREGNFLRVIPLRMTNAVAMGGIPGGAKTLSFSAPDELLGAAVLEALAVADPERG